MLFSGIVEPTDDFTEVHVFGFHFFPRKWSKFKKNKIHFKQNNCFLSLIIQHYNDKKHGGINKSYLFLHDNKPQVCRMITKTTVIEKKKNKQ